LNLCDYYYVFLLTNETIVRGQKGYDKATLRKLIFICSELIESYLEIDAMDLNPVLLFEKGLDVVDARIILKK
jgi:hypothetical protein